MKDKTNTQNGNRKKKKKKKSWLSSFLVAILLIGGLGLMLYPKISDLYQRYLLSQEMNRYNQLQADLNKSDNPYEEDWAKAEAYNQWLLEKDVQLSASKEEEEYAATLLNPLGNGMLGTIDIPRIDVQLPVYQGTDETQLQSGAGWWIGSSLPTGGESTHCIITAHTGLVKAELFTNIDKLKEGDTFSLHVLDRDLYYQVDQILVTEPIETEPLQIVPGKDYVTLYTCTPYGVNTHRLLVRGVRIDEPEVDIPEVIVAKAKNYWWLIALLLLPLLFLLWKILRRKKPVPVPVPVPAPAAEEPAPWIPGLTRQIPLQRRKTKHSYRTVRKLSNGETLPEKKRFSKKKAGQKQKMTDSTRSVPVRKRRTDR